MRVSYGLSLAGFLAFASLVAPVPAATGNVPATESKAPETTAKAPAPSALALRAGRSPFGDLSRRQPSPKRSERNLLDVNRDGKVNLRDAFRLAGAPREERAVGFGETGQFGRVNAATPPESQSLDLTADGKVTVRNPVPLASLGDDFSSGQSRLKINSRGFSYTRAWRF